MKTIIPMGEIFLEPENYAKFVDCLYEICDINTKYEDHIESIADENDNVIFDEKSLQLQQDVVTAIGVFIVANNLQISGLMGCLSEEIKKYNKEND